MNCENCGTEPSTILGCRLWKEIRVGHVESPERFHLCPECDRDSTVDPAYVWAETAETHEVTLTT